MFTVEVLSLTRDTLISLLVDDFETHSKETIDVYRKNINKLQKVISGQDLLSIYYDRELIEIILETGSVY